MATKRRLWKLTSTSNTPCEPLHGNRPKQRQALMLTSTTACSLTLVLERGSLWCLAEHRITSCKILALVETFSARSIVFIALLVVSCTQRSRDGGFPHVTACRNGGYNATPECLMNDLAQSNILVLQRVQYGRKGCPVSWWQDHTQPAKSSPLLVK